LWLQNGEVTTGTSRTATVLLPICVVSSPNGGLG
jgi:hypothetical protein